MNLGFDFGCGGVPFYLVSSCLFLWNLKGHYTDNELDAILAWTNVESFLPSGLANYSLSALFYVTESRGDIVEWSSSSRSPCTAAERAHLLHL